MSIFIGLLQPCFYTQNLQFPIFLLLWYAACQSAGCGRLAPPTMGRILPPIKHTIKMFSGARGEFVTDFPIRWVWILWIKNVYFYATRTWSTVWSTLVKSQANTSVGQPKHHTCMQLNNKNKMPACLPWQMVLGCWWSRTLHPDLNQTGESALRHSLDHCYCQRQGAFHSKCGLV